MQQSSSTALKKLVCDLRHVTVLTALACTSKHVSTMLEHDWTFYLIMNQAVLVCAIALAWQLTLV